MQQLPVGRVTPGLRDARLIEYIGPEKSLNFHIVQALAEAGLVIREVETPSGQADTLILAHGLGGSALKSHTDALMAISAVAGRFTQTGGTLILLQNAGGSFQPHDRKCWHAGLAGLGRTAQREFPKATVRTIDVDVDGFGHSLAANRILEELLTGGSAPCVGLSSEGRIVPYETAINLTAASTGVPQPGDTFLVTGGARGVTADCVIELARQTGSNFALLGRSEIKQWPVGLPLELDEKKLRGLLAAQAKRDNRKITPADINASAKSLLAGQEIQQTLAAIEAAGGKAIYLPTDIGDAARLRTAVQTATGKFGPITGLVHGAGVLADKLIAEKTADQVERVFSPKVLGLQTILSEVQSNTLKHIVFFSSVAARYGNVGQSDYAMANEVLNRAAHAVKAANPKACVTSIGWGPWDGGMVDHGLRARFAEMGVDLISREAGARTFVSALMTGAACPVELVVGSELPHG